MRKRAQAGLSLFGLLILFGCPSQDATVIDGVNVPDAAVPVVPEVPSSVDGGGGGGGPGDAATDAGGLACSGGFATCAAALAAAGVECGPVSDGCGGTLDCASACAAPKTCGGVTAGTCSDLCASQTCSGQGTCSVVGGKAVCTCKPGFTAQGLNCINAADPCQGQTCSSHGACGVFSGVPKCACDANFYPSADKLSCLGAKEAACPPSACSGHGKCGWSLSGATVTGFCTCDPGYQPVAGEPPQCVDPCLGQTCSGHGTCSYDAIGTKAAACYCDPGFKNTGPLQCAQACGGPCAGGKYCDFASNTCKSLPADGIQYGLPRSGVTFKAVAANSAGSVYVAGGYTSGIVASPSLYSSLFLKYGSDKTKAWERTWATPVGGSQAMAVALDSAENVYTAGVSDWYQLSVNNYRANGEIVKWDPAGNKLWTFKYPLGVEGGGAQGFPAGIAVGPGSSPDIYVVGSVWGKLNGQGATNSLSDVYLLKIAGAGPGTGAVAWTKVFGPAGDSNQDKGNGVAVDPVSGDVLITGSVSGNINGVTGTTGGSCDFLGCGGASVVCNDAFVSRWTPAGVHVWTKYLGVTKQAESGAGIAIRNGAAYVSGTTAKTGGVYSPFVWKLNVADGATAWTQEVPATQLGTSRLAQFTGIAVDASGAAYATGWTTADFDGQSNKDRTGKTMDVLLSVWDTNGTRKYSKMWGSDDTTAGEMANGVAVGGTPAKVFIAGDGVTNLTQQGTNASFILYAAP